MTNIELNFVGYFRNSPVEKYSNVEGIYIVYAGKQTTSNRCEINRILYIGESCTTITERLAKHNKKQEWQKSLKEDESLYFAIAAVKGADRRNAEAALIYRHKPKFNTEYIEDYPYDKVAITTKIGKNSDLKFITPMFSV